MNQVLDDDRPAPLLSIVHQWLENERKESMEDA